MADASGGFLLYTESTNQCPTIAAPYRTSTTKEENCTVAKDVTGQEKRKLTKERAETLAELDHLREYLKSEVDFDIEEASPDLHERGKALGLIQVLENKLESIEKALRLVEKGTYGICEKCGKRIDLARLEALPHTTLCVKCKSQMERVSRMSSRSGVR